MSTPGNTTEGRARRRGDTATSTASSRSRDGRARILVSTKMAPRTIAQLDLIAGLLGTNRSHIVRETIEQHCTTILEALAQPGETGIEGLTTTARDFLAAADRQNVFTRAELLELAATHKRWPVYRWLMQEVHGRASLERYVNASVLDRATSMDMETGTQLAEELDQATAAGHRQWIAGGAAEDATAVRAAIDKLRAWSETVRNRPAEPYPEHDRQAAATARIQAWAADGNTGDNSAE